MDAGKGARVTKTQRALSIEQTITTDDMGFRTEPQTVVWHSMAEAPQDGRAIMLKAALDDGVGVPAIWYRTRRWQRGKWERVAFWANPVTKWPLQFEPHYWRQPVYGDVKR